MGKRKADFQGLIFVDENDNPIPELNDRPAGPGLRYDPYQMPAWARRADYDDEDWATYAQEHNALLGYTEDADGDD